MSIYDSLGFPVPLISYTVMHQPKAGVDREEYEGTLRDMHARLAAESDALSAQYAKDINETAIRQSQMLRGALTQFLETPIRSDNAEVQKIFLEAFDEFREQSTELVPHGVTVSSEGVVTTVRLSGAAKKLETNGRRYLRELGFSSGKAAPAVYESLYIVRGGGNLDVLEHLVRDRLGIYGSTHGKHVANTAMFAFAAHNRVLLGGGEVGHAQRSAWGEAALFFSKPPVAYEEFRAALVPVVDAVSSLPAVSSVSAWQRKLGLGGGHEFVLRILLGGPDGVSRIIDALRGAAAHDEAVRESLAGRACLLIKEFILPLIA